MVTVLLGSVYQRVLGWILLWFVLYRTLNKLLRHRSAEYSCRIITLFHAVVIAALACYVTFFSGISPYKSLGFQNTNEQLWIITTSLGYFCYDFTWCLYYRTEGPIMLLHHIVSITQMSICLYLEVSGTEIVATIFGSEVTSVFLNIRWFLKEHDQYNDKPAGFLIDLVFVSLFIIVRICVGGHLAVSVWYSDLSPLVVKLGGIVFWSINFVFLLQIVSFARYRLRSWKKQQFKNKTSACKKGTAAYPTVQNGVRHRATNDLQKTLVTPCIGAKLASHTFDQIYL